MTTRDSVDEFSVWPLWQISHQCVTGPSPSPVHMYISLTSSGRADPAGSLSARQPALSWLTSAARPGATQKGPLIPTQPCCGGKHSFLLVSADKQGRAVLLVTCRRPASWKDGKFLLVTCPPPQLCGGPLWLCRGVWPPASAASCCDWSSWMDLGFEVNERCWGWCESGGFVSQPCYAKTTVALIQTCTTFHPGCGSRTLLLPHCRSSFSEFSKKCVCWCLQQRGWRGRTDAEHVAVWCPLVADTVEAHKLTQNNICILRTS